MGWNNDCTKRKWNEFLIKWFCNCLELIKKNHEWPLLTPPLLPEWGFAPVQPVVLKRAVRAAVLVSLSTPQTYPEVSIRGTEISDELLYDLLLGRGLDAQQLASVSFASALRLLKVQLPAQLWEIGQFVTRSPFSCLAHSLTWTETQKKRCEVNRWDLFFAGF